MSRIPVRTPSRSGSRNGQISERDLNAGPPPLQDLGRHRAISKTKTTTLSDPFRAPSRPKDNCATPAPPVISVRTSENGYSARKPMPKSPSVPSRSSQVAENRPVTAVRSLQAQRAPELRKAKSSAGLREHIARARAELYKSARKPTKLDDESTASELEPLDFSLRSEDPEDPFSAIKDPFNQAKFRPKANPAVDRAVKKARQDGRLMIANTGLTAISRAVYDMYKPDPSHVIDFSMDSGSAWYDYTDLTHFNAADNDVSEIEEEFVDVFGGVSSIDLHNNRLSSLPQNFLQLSMLSCLNLAGNQIDNATINLVCQIETLTELNISRNGLTGILTSNISNLSQLGSLDISDNEFDAIDYSLLGCLKLQKLNLSGNKIERCAISQVSKLPGLLELDASRNKITAPFIDATLSFPRLQILNLSNNAISTLSKSSHVIYLPSLDSLILLQNQLTNLSGLDCPNLRTLSLAGNRLSCIPPALFHSTLGGGLKYLDVSDNYITEIDLRVGFMGLSGFEWGGNRVKLRSCYGLSTIDMLKFLRGRAGREEHDGCDG